MEKSNIKMAPSARRPLDGTGVRRISGRTFKIGTWNVRSLKSPEKVFNLCKEMNRLNIDILGISDTNSAVNIRKIKDVNCKPEVSREINDWAAKAKQSHGSVEEHQLKTRAPVEN
ncbi:hypothetical protein ACJJTC_016002 [Scirpophaga incertulas]